MNNYIDLATRTEAFPNPITDHSTLRLLHAAMGMQTEAGEFTDMLKRHIFYGKPIDVTNLKEELGDMMWYIAIAMDTLGTDFWIEMDRNIRKLQRRYPDKFTGIAALNRDLDAERKELEK